MTVRTRDKALAGAILALALLAGPALARGDGKAGPPTDLKTALKGVAAEIQAVLKKVEQTSVAMADFRGPPHPQSASGPMVQAALEAALTQLGVTVKQEGAFAEVRGDFRVLDSEEHKGELIIRLTIEICSVKDGRRLNEFEKKVGYNSNGGTGGEKANLDVAKLLAINYDGKDSPKIDPAGQSEKLRQNYEKPPLELKGTKIKVSDESPYAVEVLTRPKGSKADPKAKVPENRKGLANVEINRGEEYQLRLHNDSDLEAAVTITIDGVDALHFFEAAEGKKKPTSFLVKPKSNSVIKGWRRDNESVNAFLVGSFAESAAAKVLSSSQKVGTITVCFHPCWSGKAPAKYGDGRNAEGEATGLGQEIKSKSSLVSRTIGPFEAIVSIRYAKKAY